MFEELLDNDEDSDRENENSDVDDASYVKSACGSPTNAALMYGENK